MKCTDRVRVAIPDLLYVCVNLKHQMVLTHDPAMETAVASDMYYTYLLHGAESFLRS